MTSRPPRVATWLLERLAPRPHRESLVGDLIEQFDRGRSAMWYRRQALLAILMGCASEIRSHKLLAIRALAVGYAGIVLVYVIASALRRAVVFGGRASVPWGDSEVMRQFWVWYGVPFSIVTCIGFVAIGWTVGKLHRTSPVAMVLLCAALQVALASVWLTNTWSLLQAGLWPFWDYRLALMFQGFCLIVAYPSCLVLGGILASPGDHENPRPIAI